MPPLVIDAGETSLEADLTVPADPLGVVVFVHGAGSSRHSPRNAAVARTLREHRFATLLFDLLVPGEEERRFDIALLTRRLLHVLDELTHNEATANLPMGLFGASTGAAAALGAAAAWPEEVRAIVCRGGRPDLAGEALSRVQAPTLLVVGENDHEVRRLNVLASRRFGDGAQVRVVQGASHLFEERGALEAVAGMAVDWFGTTLA